MSPQKAKAKPESLTPWQFSVRLVIVGVIISVFIFLAFFLNHWHLSSQTKPVAQSTPLSAQEIPREKPLPQQPIAPEEKVPLTFYDRLSEKSTPSDPIETASPTAAKQNPVLPASRKKTGPAGPDRPAPEQKNTEAEKKTTVGNFTIQIGSFQDLKQALRVLEQLKQKGYAPHMVFYPSGGGQWYRVRLGSYQVREEAEAKAQELKAKANVQGLVVSLKGQ